jgi:hypothetical protein
MMESRPCGLRAHPTARCLSIRPPSPTHTLCSPAPAALPSSCPQLTAPTEVGGRRTWRLTSTVGMHLPVYSTLLTCTARTCHPAHPPVSELRVATAD